MPLSIVVVAYDIERELPRTLQSLSAGYQRDVDADDYEVIVVDNGSPTPVDESVFAGLDGSFRLLTLDDAPPSPARAANAGLAAARGEAVGVMLDGARLVSPGLVRHAIAASKVHERAAVVTLGWYLGHDFQRYAMQAGWSKADEDELLRSIDWPNDGYRLFEVATMDESSVDGWFFGAFESNCLFLPAAVWADMGGFDERFDIPGGGLVNHDVLRQAANRDDLGWVVLLGEATFHQLHGGVATNVTPEEVKDRFERWQVQYREIRGGGAPEAVPFRDAMFFGTIPEPLRLRYGFGVNTWLYDPARMATPLPPEVRLGDPAAEPEPMAAQLLAEANRAVREHRNIEAQAFARDARAASPHNDGAHTLLRFLAHPRVPEDLKPEERAQYLVDCGHACVRAGQHERAEAHYRAALELQPGKLAAYEALSRLRMPGPDYQDRLARIHDALNPATYLEIGVFEGESLAHAKPPTIAVGVDPAPQIREPISVEFHLYREISSAFFERDVRALFGGAGPSLVFIDGLHEFPAVLEDFARVEAISDPDTVVLLHDMIPFDEVTQRAERVHEFYTGDVWKLLHCLADVRPDLEWFTIRTAPSGLTCLSGLDPSSTVLRDQFDKLVKRYGELDFEESLEVPGPVLENDWALVSDRLAALKRTAKERRGDMLVPARPDDAEGLARRTRELEALTTEQRKEITNLKRAARRTGSLSAPIDPDSALAELERLRATKLFRYSRAVRDAYSRLRHTASRARGRRDG